MNLFKILNKLFTSENCKWVLELDESDINPFMIQRFLSLHKKSRKKARVLNKFCYTLPPKMYLTSAWSLLFFNGEKLNKSPYIKYPKKNKENNEKYDFIYKKVQEQYNLSDKDLNVMKPFIKNEVEKNKVEWFSYYGVEKRHWVENGIDFELIKKYKNEDYKINKKVDKEFESLING